MLQPDAELPTELVKNFGRPLTLKERLKYKIYGIGFFKPATKSSDILSQWFAQNNNTVRPHLDQLTKGLVFRLTESKRINALAISIEEIDGIIIRKSPDEITAIPFSPFWILLKLGFSPRRVSWASRYEFSQGDVEVRILLQEGYTIDLLWEGNKWELVNRFFKNPFLKPKLKSGRN